MRQRKEFRKTLIGGGGILGVDAAPAACMAKKFGGTEIIAYLCRQKKERDRMHVIARSTLTAYYTRNPQSKAALEEWYAKTVKASWTCFADIKRTFNSVDSVGNQHYVFNIKGNDYRLVVVIQFTPQRVYIRFVGTHSEYDRIKDIKNI